MMLTRFLSHDHGVSLTPLLSATIGETFDQIVSEFPDCEALVSSHENRRLTYRELSQKVEATARALMALGVGKGDRVGIWSTNRTEWIITQFATAKIGAILVNINPAYRIREVAFAIQQSECGTVIIGDGFRDVDYSDIFHELIPTLRERTGTVSSEDFPWLRHVIHLGAVGEKSRKRDDGILVWAELLSLADQVSIDQLGERQALLGCDDVINIQYTSGTTGSPKGAALTHHNILNNGHWVAEYMRLTNHDRLCIAVPLYHCFGMVLGNLACVTRGATMVMPSPFFSPLAVLQACERERCTAIHGVPTMFIAQLQHPEFASFDLSTLRTGIMAGAPCPIDVMNRVINEMHCQEILIAYGQTEASPVTNMTQRDDPIELRVGTVGRVMPHQELKIVDPLSGRTLPRDEQGELCFRGYHVMRGYYNNPDGTREAIDECGWLHSGDLGVMDSNGYVRITGRLKDMIIRGGENIYPREIEEFLFAHPKIAEAYVIGIPDTHYGEEVMAWIKVRDGADLTEHDIREYCQGQIADFKIPRHIKFVTEFPMTVTGKVQKFRMREIAMGGE